MTIEVVSIKECFDMSQTRLYHAIVTIGGVKMDARYKTNPTNGRPHLTEKEFVQLIKDEYEIKAIADQEQS